MLLTFPHANPGFDLVIVSPLTENKIHSTFIETRYSADASGTSETTDAYNLKYKKTLEVVSQIEQALSLMGVSLDWHYVYAIYRKTSIDQQSLQRNTIFMNRSGLDAFYGPSLSSLGML